MQVSVTLSQWIPTDKLRLFQVLLSSFSGWFKFDPKPLSPDDKETRVTVCFESVRDLNEFNAAWGRFNTPIVEKTRKKTWLRTLKNFLSRHF